MAPAVADCLSLFLPDLQIRHLSVFFRERWGECEPSRPARSASGPFRSTKEIFSRPPGSSRRLKNESWRDQTMQSAYQQRAPILQSGRGPKRVLRPIISDQRQRRLGNRACGVFARFGHLAVGAVGFRLSGSVGIESSRRLLLEGTLMENSPMRPPNLCRIGFDGHRATPRNNRQTPLPILGPCPLPASHR